MKEAVEVVLVVAMVVVMSGWARAVHVNKMQRQDSHHHKFWVPWQPLYRSARAHAYMHNSGLFPLYQV